MSLALDANVCIEVLRFRHPGVLARYKATDPRDILIPSIVAAELLVGAEKSVRLSAEGEVNAFLARHTILSFGESEMREYARIRATLERAGTKIGPNDLIVAATVLVAGTTLVTHNVREFSRVPSLPLDDWQAET